MFFVEKISGQKAHKSFSGKFGQMRAKILRTPKNLLENFTADSEANLLDLVANQPKWQHSP